MTTSRLHPLAMLLVLVSCIAVGVAVLASGRDASQRLPAARDAADWPFAAASPWNSPLGHDARFAPADDPRTRDLRRPVAAINASTWSVPVFRATDADPVRDVRTPAGIARFRIPDDAAPAGPRDGDRHLAVIDPTGRWVDECWLARHAGSRWSCRYHVRNSLRGPGILAGGTRAYGGSALGGLIRTWELDVGVLRHALAFALPRRYLRHGPVWPAASEDEGADYGGHVPMGTLVAIPPHVDLGALGLSPTGLVIARALQVYGAYLVDASENFTLFAEPTAEPLLGAARRDLGRIRDQLRIVENNGPEQVGGGGAATAPSAPPFR
jgi:hypothetical protein